MGYPRQSLKVDEWPAPDQRRWADANRSGGHFETSGRAAHWTEKTRAQVAKDYGRFLYILQKANALDVLASPGDRVTTANLRVYFECLKAAGMATTSLLSRARNLHEAIRVMEPRREFAQLRTSLAKLKALAEPRRRKQDRLANPEILIDKALFAYDRFLPSTHEPLTVDGAYKARDALMMALLASRPIRLANFAAIRLDKNLIRNGAGFTLTFDAHETKERLVYECAIPDELVRYIDHYLLVVRPILLRDATSDRLWISMRSTPMSDSTVYYQITKITRRLIGRPINPHLFRDCAMTAIANHRPENVGAGARLLGHRNLATSEKHYNQATSLAAQRQHAEIIKKLRSVELECDTIGET